MGGGDYHPRKNATIWKNTYNEVVAVTIPVLPYTEKAAQWHAVKWVRLSQIGKTPSFVDAQIAATAVIHGLVLITNNLTDYADFEELQTRDWRI